MGRWHGHRPTERQASKPAPEVERSGASAAPPSDLNQRVAVKASQAVELLAKRQASPAPAPSTASALDEGARSGRGRQLERLSGTLDAGNAGLGRFRIARNRPSSLSDVGAFSVRIGA